MNWIQRFLAAITTHKTDASAHHAKTTIEDLSPIALADLDPAVCSETKAVALIASYIRKAIVENFQQVPGTGTATDPNQLNDATTENIVVFTLNQYVLIELLCIVKITQFRFFKKITALTSDDGEIKIEYRNPTDGSWNDWVTGKVIPMDVDEWMSWDSSGGQVTCDAIRITCTKVDTDLGSIRIGEIEVKY